MKSHTVAAGEFKAHCLRLLDEVNKHHTALVITKHGKPVAKLVPVTTSKPSTALYGCLKDTVVIHDDIVSPTDEAWDAD